MSQATHERPVAAVRGTTARLPAEYAGLAALETLLLDRFARAGYEQMRTPVLEPTELHERKSGAAIVSKLYELADGHGGSLCLRPELTAGIVRAYTAAPEAPPLPFRVAQAGSVFRREKAPAPGLWREFRQVGVELIGAGGPAADAEAISLADWAAAESGVNGVTIRLGHVGLILEMLRRSGLPAAARAALVETFGEAAAEGGDATALERGLDNLADWLAATGGADEEPIASVTSADDGGVDRLFRTLVPVINGRRQGHEIVGRLRRKWDLGHSLRGTLDRVRGHARALAALQGPPGEVLDRLARDHADLAPDSVAELRALVATLGHHGIDPGRIHLDIGFGRGIGFYSQVIFELIAPTQAGPVEVCGGGRYDGLARVLGSDRDDRGVGFAFGLERLAAARDGASGDLSRRRGVVVVGGEGRDGEGDRAAIRLATLLRSQGCPVHLMADGSVEEGRSYARALGLTKTFEVAQSESPGSQNPLLWVEGDVGGAEVVGGREVRPGGPFGFVREEDLVAFARAEAGAQR